MCMCMCFVTYGIVLYSLKFRPGSRLNLRTTKLSVTSTVIVTVVDIHDTMCSLCLLKHPVLLCLCSLMAEYTCACGGHMAGWMEGCSYPQKCTRWILRQKACDCLICINNCLMQENYEVICVYYSDCAFVDPLLCMLCRFTQNSMLLKLHGSLVVKAQLGLYVPAFSTVCMCLCNNETCTRLLYLHVYTHAVCVCVCVYAPSLIRKL